MKDHIKEMTDYIIKRQKVSFKREFGYNDPWEGLETHPLSKYKFCNVYRETDRCSKHVIANVLNNPELNLEDKIFNIFVYRFFNTPYFFSDIIPPIIVGEFDRTKFVQALDDKPEDKNLFSGAYLISQCKVDKNFSSAKHVQVSLILEKVANEIEYVVDNVLDDPYKAIEVICSFDLIGPFLGYQILLDISYMLESSYTDEDYYYIGPGAEEGLKIIFGDYVKSKDYDTKMTLIRSEIMHQINRQIGMSEWKIMSNVPYRVKKDPFPLSYLTLSDIEFNLCEYRKLVHWSEGRGRKKHYKFKEEI